MRRKRQRRLMLLILVPVFVLLGFLTNIFFHVFSAGYQTEKLVNTFYTLEQDGDFSDSWELLHPYMKDKWKKGAFIQDRAHVFINHFGAETFQFTVIEGDRIDEWSMSQNLPPVDTAYQFTVTQTYEGKYGKFSFIQEVYVAEDNGEWRILWDYN